MEGRRWLTDLLTLAAGDLLPNRLGYLMARWHFPERLGDRGRQMAQIN